MCGGSAPPQLLAKAMKTKATRLRVQDLTRRGPLARRKFMWAFCLWRRGVRLAADLHIHWQTIIVVRVAVLARELMLFGPRHNVC